jgi:hypothetical protein
MAVMAVVYGFDYALPLVWRGVVFRLATLAVLGGFAGALWMAMHTTWRRRDWSRLAALLCGCELTLSLFFALPTRLALTAIGALALLLAFLWRWLGAGAVVVAAVAVGFMVYVVSIAVVPIDPIHADMLPFIGHAIDVWRAGGDPYTADFSGITANPFLYLPAQWLVFLPARALGVDLRVVNLLSAAAMIGLVEWRARRGQPELRAGVYPVMLSPLLLPMMYSGQVWPYWLVILGLALLLLRGRWAWAGGAAGLAIGFRQTALLAGGALVVGLFHRLPLRVWLGALVAAAAALGFSTAPFIASFASVRAMLLFGPSRALALAHEMGNPANQIASSNLLQAVGLARFDLGLEALAGLAAMLVAHRAARHGVRPVLVAAGLGYALAVSANPYLFRYYDLAGLLLAGVGLTAEREPPESALS